MSVRGTESIWEIETFGEVLVDLTVGELIDQQANEFPHHEALVYRYPECGIDLSLTYSQLKERVDRVARGLIALGVGPGDKVAVLATNLPQWIFLELAVAKIGSILVTVNTNSRRAELEYLLRQADIHTLILMRSWRDNDYHSNIQSLVPEFTKRSHILEPVKSVAFPHLRHAVYIEEVAPEGHLSLTWIEELSESVPASTVKERQSRVEPNDIFQIQFTSGTTGNPKGAMITHHGAINNGRMFAGRVGITSKDRLVSAMPLFHTAGNIMEVMGVFVNGATLVKAISFEPQKMLELIHTEYATILSAVPTMVIAMMSRHEENGRACETSSLRLLISGGTPIPVPLMEQVSRIFGAQPVIGFGMTEASPMVTCTLKNDSFDLKSSTVGIPLPHSEVKVVDSEGKAVPVGQPGELLIRGYQVMKGYYKDTQKTEETIDRDGWLHSGDQAVMDAKGYIRIVGRIKDMVIRGGENVYPAEVENFLMRHPSIKQAQVVGVPDPYMGEETAAFIQLRDGHDLTEESLVEHCKAQIARHKVPKYVRFVHDFPITPSGKVKKFDLRDQLVKELNQY